MKSRAWTALPLDQRPGLRTVAMHTFQHMAEVRLLEFCPLDEASSLIFKFGQRLCGIQSGTHGCHDCPVEDAVVACREPLLQVLRNIISALTTEMDDDYIVDDISLDGETLALLDQEEQKYLTLQKDAFVDAPPVNKKRRTDSGWRPGHPSADDFEDLPEISVYGDGTYRVRDVARNNQSSAPRNLLNANTESSTPRLAVQSNWNNSVGPNNIHEQSSPGTRARNVPVVAPQRASSFSRGPGQNTQLEVQLQDLQRRVFEVQYLLIVPFLVYLIP